MTTPWFCSKSRAFRLILRENVSNCMSNEYAQVVFHEIRTYKLHAQREKAVAAVIHTVGPLVTLQTRQLQQYIEFCSERVYTL